jgi:hypothetical protein
VAKKLGKVFFDDLAVAAGSVTQANLPLDAKEEPRMESVDPLAAGQKIDDISILDLRQQTGKPGTGKIAEPDDTRGQPFDDGERAEYLDRLCDRNQFTENPLRPIGTMPIRQIVMPGPEINDAILVPDRTEGLDKLRRVPGESEGENGFKEGDAIEPIGAGDHHLWLIDRAAER